LEDVFNIVEKVNRKLRKGNGQSDNFSIQIVICLGEVCLKENARISFVLELFTGVMDKFNTVTD